MGHAVRLFTGLTLCAIALLAQSDANKGSIVGNVSDPRQAVIPNAKVTALNAAIGLTRETTTNEAGQYRFGALDPGTYQVKAEAPGFAPATVNDVLVNVGVAVTVNLSVALQPTVQTVDVSSTFLQVSESTNSQVVGLQAIQDLPINGRRFHDFAALTPTVQFSSDTRGQLSFAGQRGINGNVMVDGTDYNEPFFGGIRGGERSVFAPTVPQSAIQEFQAVAAGYTAEYGRSSGGILNAITRSGSNGYHGDGFYQLRHKELGLKNPLNQQSLETQHQFGGGVGGPIKRDKLFFFGAAERQVARYPRQVRFANLDSVAGNVTADIKPAYDYFRSLEGPYKQTNDATALLGRVDYQFSGGSRLTGRYNYSRDNAENGASTGNILNPEINNALSNNGTEKDNTHTAVGQLTSVLSPTMVNDLRVQYSREERPRINNSSTPTVAAGIIGLFGSVRFLPTTLTDYRLQFADAITIQRGGHSFKLGGDYSHLNVVQTFGFNQFGYYNISGAIASNVRAVLQTLSATGAGGVNRFDNGSITYQRQIGNLTLGAGTDQLAFFGQDAWRITRNFTLNYGVRWEGQFNPSPATNNDFLVTNVRDFIFPLGRVNPTVIRDQLDQWAPRVGFAWNITGDNKTVMRAQTGIYYAQTPTLIYAGPLNNFRLPAGDLSLQIGPSPTVYQTFLSGGIDLNKVTPGTLPILSAAQVSQLAGPGRNPFFRAGPVTTSADNYRNPKAYQVTYGFERQLATGLVVDYQLNHVNTVHLERNIDYNIPRPIIRQFARRPDGTLGPDLSQRAFFGLNTGDCATPPCPAIPRPNPNLSALTVRDSGARSNFTGNTFRVQYRTKAVQLALSYTLSFNKSDDDNERNTTGTTFYNAFNLGREYNWSVFDTRHQFGGYVVYQLPWGIEVSGLLRFRTGYPIDPITGSDTGEVQVGGGNGQNGNRPLEKPGIPFLRNSFRNNGYKDVDLRFLKSFKTSENTKLQFSVEMFNVFTAENIAFITASNMGSPGTIYGLGINTDGTPAAVDARFKNARLASGAYNSSSVFQQGTPFQAQLGLRFIF